MSGRLSVALPSCFALLGVFGTETLEERKEAYNSIKPGDSFSKKLSKYSDVFFGRMEAIDRIALFIIAGIAHAQLVETLDAIEDGAIFLGSSAFSVLSLPLTQKDQRYVKCANIWPIDDAKEDPFRARKTELFGKCVSFYPTPSLEEIKGQIKDVLRRVGPDKGGSVSDLQVANMREMLKAIKEEIKVLETNKPGTP